MGDFDVAIEDCSWNDLLDEEIEEVQFVNEDRTMEDFFNFDAFQRDLPFLTTEVQILLVRLIPPTPIHLCKAMENGTLMILSKIHA
ncbi:hypothetical protein FRX31_012748, partial [Thalictrum thalictroides]